jgi:uncharacterized membrane protein YoaK (UPF0700 family)
MKALAALLAALAGYVDAIGFLTLGGFFVSFMSGNSTRLGVGLAGRSAEAVAAASLIALFVAGVVAGSLLGHFAGRRRRPAVLALVALLLCAAAWAGTVAGPWGAGIAMALAMGAENAVFEKDGEVQIGLTYMTGTLVKLGQRLGGALLGGPSWAWAPYLLLWGGLALGAALGALAHAALGLAGLWIAAAVAAAAALLAPGLEERPSGP